MKWWAQGFFHTIVTASANIVLNAYHWIKLYPFTPAVYPAVNILINGHFYCKEHLCYLAYKNSPMEKSVNCPVHKKYLSNFWV